MKLESPLVRTADKWRAAARQLNRLAFCAALATLVAAGSAALSASPDREHSAAASRGQPRPVQAGGIAWPTLGGRQFWVDRRYQAGWRMQQNVLTGHFRLLDPADRRHAWGKESEVAAAFSERPRAEETAAAARRLVVLLHGWGRTRAMFDGLAEALRAEGYEVVRLSYPSTQGDLARHGKDLATFLGSLEGRPQVSFVTHSLGAMVLRRMLADRPAFANGIVLDRAVLIAPPNRGAEMARRLHGFPLFDWLGGPVGADLLPAAVSTLPAPDIPFMVIAGGRGTADGWNPLVPGDDDGIVSVAETRLDAADSLLVVPSLHSFIVNHPQSIAACIAFLGATDAAAGDRE